MKGKHKPFESAMLEDDDYINPVVGNCKECGKELRYQNYKVSHIHGGIHDMWCSIECYRVKNPKVAM